jgi:hypothetical protein
LTKNDQFLKDADCFTGEDSLERNFPYLLPKPQVVNGV